MTTNVFDNFVEQASAHKHARWAEWQKSVFSKCALQEDGSLLFPAEEVQRRTKLIETDYKDLSEENKDKDRYEAKLLLPIVRELFVEKPRGSAGKPVECDA